MGHIFISYSHKDKKYVEKLEKKLISEGFDVWIDHRIDYGDDWPEEIQNAIDTCDAFIVVMSETASESVWVRREVIHAERRNKPFFPLLLKGEFWFSLGNIQFVDVTDSSLPPEKYYNHLATVTEREKKPRSPSLSKTEKTLSPLVQAIVLGESIKNLVKKSNPKIVIPVFLVLLWLVIFGFPKFTITPTPPPTTTSIETHSFTATSEPISTNTPTLKPISTSTEVPTQIPTSTQIATITSSPTITSTPTPLPLAILDVSGVDMVLVPDGVFTMGSEETDEEDPVQEKHVGLFYIDKYEVTNDQYATCVNLGVCDPPIKMNSYTHVDYYENPSFKDFPVINVNWYMVVEYCQWRDARLPTETEWEKAARGVDARIYPWGNTTHYSRANYYDFNGDTVQVGTYDLGRSPYGVYDMAGNVREWVSSTFTEYPYKTSDGREDALSTSPRVIRGGAWNSSSVSEIRTSYRSGLYPSSSSLSVGFRCVHSIAP